MNETTVHDVKMESWTKHGVCYFRGVCSCGAISDVVGAAGLVHGWEADHINRYPHLTAALVTASAMASGFAKNGRGYLARHALSDAQRLAQELRLLTVVDRRDAEALALALFEKAAEDVAAAAPVVEEGPPEVSGSEDLAKPSAGT